MALRSQTRSTGAQLNGAGRRFGCCLTRSKDHSSGRFPETLRLWLDHFGHTATPQFVRVPPSSHALIARATVLPIALGFRVAHAARPWTSDRLWPLVTTETAELEDLPPGTGTLEVEEHMLAFVRSAKWPDIRSAREPKISRIDAHDHSESHDRMAW